MQQKALTEYAQRLDAIKSRFKLKNTELARIAGVSDNSISKIMSGLTEAPDVRILASIAKKFNISGDWLLLGEGPMIKEESADTSKKGLQVRDELIAQLQRELWGKFKGAIEEPALQSGLGFDAMMGQYKRLVADKLGLPVAALKSESLLAGQKESQWHPVLSR